MVCPISRLLTGALIHVYRILVPLYLLILNLSTIFFLPVDDLSSRSANSMTGFLAAFAFLFVVGESLPKVGGSRFWVCSRSATPPKVEPAPCERW